MKYPSLYLLLSFLCLSIYSCGYHLAIGETMEGKKVIYKAYSNTERGEKKKLLSIFKYSQGMGFPKYTGAIHSDTIPNGRFVAYDSVRVYLHISDDFTYLFTSGILSGQMFYCAANTNCKPFNQSGYFSINAAGDTIMPHLYGYRGHGISISRVSELRNLQQKPTHRRFELCVNPIRSFGTGCMIYLLELTNDQANEKTDLKTFLAGSRVTVLRHVWTEI